MYRLFMVPFLNSFLASIKEFLVRTILSVSPAIFIISSSVAVFIYRTSWPAIRRYLASFPTIMSAINLMYQLMVISSICYFIIFSECNVNHRAQKRSREYQYIVIGFLLIDVFNLSNI